MPDAPASSSAPLLRMARQGGIYAVGNAAAKASGYFVQLLQLNTAYLAFAHYGKLSAAANLVLLLAPLLTLGLPTALLRFTTASDLGDDDRAALPFTTLVVVGGLAALVVALAWPFAAAIGRAGVLGQDPAGLEAQAALLGRLVLMFAAVKALSMLGLVTLQARDRPGLFSLAQLSEAVLLIGLNAWLLVGLRMGLVGVLVAQIGAAAVPAFMLAGWIAARSARRVAWGLLRPLLRFGLPVVVVGLSLPILQAGDRHVLNWWKVEPEALSLYEAASKVAGLVNVVLIQAFQTAFAVAGLQAIASGEGAHLHRRAFRHLCVIGGGFTLGLSLFAFDVLAVMTPKGSPYLQAAPLVLPLTLGYYFYGLYIIAANPLYARGRTRQVSVGVAIAAVVNLLLNVVLIPPLGAVGSATATVLAYGGLALVTAARVGKAEGVRFPFGAVAGTVALVVGLGWIGLRANSFAPVPRWAAHFALMVLYPPGVLLVRAYRWSDIRDGADALWAWRARKRAGAARKREGQP